MKTIKYNGVLFAVGCQCDKRPDGKEPFEADLVSRWSDNNKTKMVVYGYHNILGIKMPEGCEVCGYSPWIVVPVSMLTEEHRRRVLGR